MDVANYCVEKYLMYILVCFFSFFEHMAILMPCLSTIVALIVKHFNINGYIRSLIAVLWKLSEKVGRLIMLIFYRLVKFNCVIGIGCPFCIKCISIASVV